MYRTLSADEILDNLDFLAAKSRAENDELDKADGGQTATTRQEPLAKRTGPKITPAEVAHSEPGAPLTGNFSVAW